MRASLQELQADFRRGSAEREQLQQHLAEREAELATLRTKLAAAEEAARDVADKREGAAAEVVAASVARAQSAEEALAVARERVKALEREVSEAHSGNPDGAASAAATRRLEEQLASRAAEIAALKEKVARDAAAAAASPAITAVRPDGAGPASRPPFEAPEPPDDGFPKVSGLRFEQVLESSEVGTRYLARGTSSREAVAVWVLSCSLGELENKRIDSMLLARHTNLVSALSFGVSKAGPHLVLERPVGEAADAWVGRIGPLPENIALAVVQQCARGLRQAAFQGVLHGDLSPTAVLIDAAGHVQVEDVGTAALISSEPLEPKNVRYAAPERLRGESPPDVSADVYSLGAILYFLLTGEAPYEGDKESVLRTQAAAGMPDPRESRSQLSEGAARLVTRLTTFDPADRPSTWDEVLVEVERQMPGGVSSELKGNLRHRLARVTAARPALLAILLPLPLLLVAAAAFLMGGTKPSPRERFEEASRQADVFVERGDLQQARELIQPFLTDAGDPAVERDAARRMDALE
jgi:hypothetical protein